MSLVLGVDAGNTKTIALVAEPSGRIVGAARALGCADIYAARTTEAVVSVVSSAVAEALSTTGAAASDLTHATFSMAGADWPEDIAELTDAMRAAFRVADTHVVNDAIGALQGAVPEGPAVVVSIGTGAAIGARGAEGRVWHSGWWQEPQGAYELSRRALRAAARDELGIQAAEALSARLRQATGMPSVEELLRHVTARATRRDTLTQPLARAVLDAAAEGDSAARTVVETHGLGLGQVAYAAARRVGVTGEPFSVAFTGGLVAAGADALVDAAIAELMRRAPAARRVPARWPPAIGALLLSLQRADATLSDVDAALDATAPPPSLYAAASADS